MHPSKEDWAEALSLLEKIDTKVDNIHKVLFPENNGIYTKEMKKAAKKFDIISKQSKN